MAKDAWRRAERPWHEQTCPRVLRSPFRQHWSPPPCNPWSPWGVLPREQREIVAEEAHPGGQRLTPNNAASSVPSAFRVNANVRPGPRRGGEPGP